MATYRGIRGITIQTVAGDPGTIQLGDIWYNNVSRSIKVGKTAAGAWATSTAVNTARNAMASAGISTAALIAGGDNGGPTDVTITEIWDGSSCTEVGDLNEDRFALHGTGTSTAALAWGGWKAPGLADLSEEWNGTAWTEGNNLPAVKAQQGAAGIQTAALSIAGKSPPTTNLVTCEEYDGTSWTAGGDINTARGDPMGSGTQTAGMAIGGGSPAVNATAANEAYDGSSWTEVGDLNQKRAAGGADGSNTATIAAAGDTGPEGPTADNNTETWNGTSWTAEAVVPTGASIQNFCIGTTAAVIMGCGTDPGPTSVTAETYEWTGETVAAATVTSS